MSLYDFLDARFVELAGLVSLVLTGCYRVVCKILDHSHERSMARDERRDRNTRCPE